MSFPFFFLYTFFLSNIWYHFTTFPNYICIYLSIYEVGLLVIKRYQFKMRFASFSILIYKSMLLPLNLYLSLFLSLPFSLFLSLFLSQSYSLSFFLSLSLLFTFFLFLLLISLFFSHSLSFSISIFFHVGVDHSEFQKISS